MPAIIYNDDKITELRNIQQNYTRGTDEWNGINDQILGIITGEVNDSTETEQVSDPTESIQTVVSGKSELSVEVELTQEAATGEITDQPASQTEPVATDLVNENQPPQ